ncbi:hypothetical protein SISNIDRAFT_469969 [Sistotremastrum niveocremeum HHB9708]|uniref:Uncharacterized protein n=1 Tax=Sistotremastrum niveocremeum HHB9708 TaxID=1314777 RepID=A0A164PGC2_9AGAM|nr:hypothetical protein SISNIDRAFT_469969 [Sistotremastrum niveocremeum HHB9708]
MRWSSLFSVYIWIILPPQLYAYPTSESSKQGHEPVIRNAAESSSPSTSNRENMAQLLSNITAEAHLDRRAGTPACGVSLRTATRDDCNRKAGILDFTFVGQPTGTVVGRPMRIVRPTVSPPGSQCDHALELQVVQFVLTQSGFCALIPDLVAAHALPRGAADVLQAIIDVINHDVNLFFLETAVNGAKRDYVVKAMRFIPLSISGTPRTGLFYPDVRQYIRNPTVDNAATTIAQSADQQIASIVRLATAIPNRSAALTNALVHYNQQLARGFSVTAVWNDVLAAQILP